MAKNYKGKNIMITLYKIKKIHTLKTTLAMSDEEYRKHRASLGVWSSKQLTDTEADILISILQKKIYIQRSQKYDELNGRDEKMATPSQLRKIEAIWNEIQSVKTNKIHKKTTLKRFLRNHFHIYDIKFLTRIKAGKIIPILEKILSSRLEEVILNTL